MYITMYNVKSYVLCRSSGILNSGEPSVPFLSFLFFPLKKFPKNYSLNLILIYS